MHAQMFSEIVLVASFCAQLHAVVIMLVVALDVDVVFLLAKSLCFYCCCWRLLMLLCDCCVELRVNDLLAVTAEMVREFTLGLCPLVGLRAKSSLLNYRHGRVLTASPLC